MNLNKAFILGNVTREPEARSLPSGQQVTNFGIATNRFYTDSSGGKKQQTEFHNIVCFGKLADTSSRYLHKGSLVLIEGRIQTRNWTNSSGTKQYRTEIIAESLQLGPRLTGQTSGNSNYQRSQPDSISSSISSNEMKEDIPIIEENYMSPTNESSDQKISFEDNKAEEIDVKDIPF
jgi:single-strand DNA-binding protein